MYDYINTALRNFWHNKVSLLLIYRVIYWHRCIGIFLVVYYKLSYDKFEPDRERIYRVVMNLKFNENEGHSAAVVEPLSKAIQNEVTGVEQTVPVMQFR